MYNDTLNGSTEKRSAELPDAVGPIVQLQEKLYVPVKEYPDVSISFQSLNYFLILAVVFKCKFHVMLPLDHAELLWLLGNQCMFHFA